MAINLAHPDDFEDLFSIDNTASIPPFNPSDFEYDLSFPRSQPPYAPATESTPRRPAPTFFNFDGAIDNATDQAKPNSPAAKLEQLPENVLILIFDSLGWKSMGYLIEASPLRFTAPAFHSVARNPNRCPKDDIPLLPKPLGISATKPHLILVEAPAAAAAAMRSQGQAGSLCTNILTSSAAITTPSQQPDTPIMPSIEPIAPAAPSRKRKLSENKSHTSPSPSVRNAHQRMQSTVSDVAVGSPSKRKRPKIALMDTPVRTPRTSATPSQSVHNFDRSTPQQTSAPTAIMQSIPSTTQQNPVILQQLQAQATALPQLSVQTQGQMTPRMQMQSPVQSPSHPRYFTPQPKSTTNMRQVMFQNPPTLSPAGTTFTGIGQQSLAYVQGQEQVLQNNMNRIMYMQQQQVDQGNGMMTQPQDSQSAQMMHRMAQHDQQPSLLQQQAYLAHQQKMYQQRQMAAAIARNQMQAQNRGQMADQMHREMPIGMPVSVTMTMPTNQMALQTSMSTRQMGPQLDQMPHAMGMQSQLEMQQVPMNMSMAMPHPRMPQEYAFPSQTDDSQEISMLHGQASINTPSQHTVPGQQQQYNRQSLWGSSAGWQG